MIVFCAMSTYVLNYTNELLMDAIEERTNSVIYVDSFADASAYLTDEVRAYASTGNTVHYDNYWNEVNTAKNRDKNIEALTEIGLEENELAMVDEISSISNNPIPIEENAMNLVEKGNLKDAIAILYGADYSAGVDNIKNIIEEFNNSI